MNRAPALICDSCILFPPSLRDLFVWLGITGACRPRWTAAIHEEWTRSVLAARTNVSAESLARCRSLMDAAVPDCLVNGYEALIPSLTLPDPDDRHVPAAAIHAGVENIVTFNLKDFPRRADSTARSDCHSSGRLPRSVARCVRGRGVPGCTEPASTPQESSEDDGATPGHP